MNSLVGPAEGGSQVMKRTENSSNAAISSSPRPSSQSPATRVTRPKSPAPIAVPPPEATRFRAAPEFQLAAADMPSREAIRERAYFLYLARNGDAGDPQSDWLQAERELIAERAKAATRRSGGQPN